MVKTVESASRTGSEAAAGQFASVNRVASLPEILWPMGPAEVRLTPDEVHVWALRLDCSPTELEELRATLSPAELDRAARFRFERHRHRFVAARGLLRSCLGSYLNMEAREVGFVYGARGKPGLGKSELEFNLAHSEELALLAVSGSGPVGVDVEWLRLPDDADELVARFFSARESALFTSLPDEEKANAFFNLWTRKEALLKATGEGIGYALNRVEVSFLPGDPAKLLSSAEAASWKLTHLNPAEGFVGALAVSRGGTAPAVRCWGKGKW